MGIKARTGRLTRNKPSRGNSSPDASQFLRKYPLPDRSITDTSDDANHRSGNLTKRVSSALAILCGRTGDATADDQDDDEEIEQHEAMYGELEAQTRDRPFYWTPILQQNFREELEK